MLQAQFGRVKVLYCTLQQGKTADVNAIVMMQYWGTLLQKIVKIEAISCILVKKKSFLNKLLIVKLNLVLAIMVCTSQNAQAKIK